MEFIEIKKIWDAQANEILYTINEKAMHKHIQSKKEQANHITNFSEWFSITVYFGSGCLIIGLNLFKQSENLFMYLLAVWMIISAGYVWISRLNRKKGEHQFDRSIRGDLAHAISVATYQVRFSQLMRWNVLPTVLIILLGFWEAGKSIWAALLLILFFIVVNYFSGWEHGIYKRKKRELESLQSKLETE